MSRCGCTTPARLSTIFTVQSVSEAMVCAAGGLMIKCVSMGDCSSTCSRRIPKIAPLAPLSATTRRCGSATRPTCPESSRWAVLFPICILHAANNERSDDEPNDDERKAAEDDKDQVE